MSGCDEDGELRYDIKKDGTASRMSCLIYLNDDFEGGETVFYTPPRRRPFPMDELDVRLAYFGGPPQPQLAGPDVTSSSRVDEQDQSSGSSLFKRAPTTVDSVALKRQPPHKGGEKNGPSGLLEDEDELIPRPVRPITGDAVCFWSAESDMVDISPWHEGAVVTQGTKYIIRTDLMFSKQGHLLPED